MIDPLLIIDERVTGEAMDLLDELQDMVETAEDPQDFDLDRAKEIMRELMGERE